MQIDVLRLAKQSRHGLYAPPLRPRGAFTQPRSEDVTTQDGVQRVSTYFRVARL